jgi:outer membrane protein assembly factor BamB
VSPLPRKLVLLALAPACLAASPGLADDWPQWRGRERNGRAARSPALAARLSQWAWRSEGLPSGEEGGRGSLAVDGGRVYGVTRGAAGGGPADEVFCLEAGTGALVWKTALAGRAGVEPSSTTPCLAGGRLYIAASTDRLHALDAVSGKELWSAPLERREKGAMASSVAVAAGAAVLLADALAAFDAETGKRLWTQEAVAGHQSSPAVWEAGDGRTFIIANGRLETACVEARSGKVVWTVPGGGLSTPAVASEYGGDFLVVLSGSRRSGLSAYRLEAAGPRRLWTVPVHDRGASPVIHDGHVYAIAGGGSGHGARAVCVHLDSGQVAWDEGIDFAEVSSPVIADGKILAVCGTFLRVIAATPEEYAVLSLTDTQATLCTSPALAGGRLFLRQASGVVAYDLRG